VFLCTKYPCTKTKWKAARGRHLDELPTPHLFTNSTCVSVVRCRAGKGLFKWFEDSNLQRESSRGQHKAFVSVSVPKSLKSGRCFCHDGYRPTGVPRSQENAHPLGRLGMRLLEGPMGGRFLLSEVPPYSEKPSPPVGPRVSLFRPAQGGAPRVCSRKNRGYLQQPCV